MWGWGKGVGEGGWKNDGARYRGNVGWIEMEWRDHLRYQASLLFGINTDGMALEQILPATSKFLLFGKHRSNYPSSAVVRTGSSGM